MAVIVIQRLAGVNAVNAFFYPGTIGILSLLVAYALTNIGAIRYLFIKARRAPLWEIVFPILAIIVVGYTLYKNVHGVPFPYNRFPFYVAGWLVVGLLIVLLWPGLSARIGATMARQEGISEEGEAAPAASP